MIADERPPLAAICEPHQQNLTVLVEVRRVRKKKCEPQMDTDGHR
jgi:hypothetical protein